MKSGKWKGKAVIARSIITRSARALTLLCALTGLTACQTGGFATDRAALAEKCAGFKPILIPRADAVVISQDLFDAIVSYNEFGSAIRCPLFE